MRSAKRSIDTRATLARRVARLSPTDERMLRRVLTMLARLVEAMQRDAAV